MPLHRARVLGGFLCGALAVLLFTGDPAWSQPGPPDHEAHHPDPPDSPAPSETGPPGGMAGGMGDMEGMMERMGVPPPRELYPEMMRLEALSLERTQDLVRRAQKRRADGSARLSVGLEDLDQAMRDDDRGALFEALAEARAGLDELESGLATEQALAAGDEPPDIALTWFRDSMRLNRPTASIPVGPFGLSWFHAFTMGLLTLATAVFVAMYFHKMKRASALLAELVHEDPPAAPVASASLTPPPLGSAPALPTSPPAAPAASPSLFEALRKTGSCGGCKNPCATRVRVAQIVDESPGVKTFRLITLDDGPLPFEYLPGQFLNVVVPAGEDGATTKRSYTIASSPTQAAHCEITVKREPEGLVSRYLHDVVQSGDELRIAAPYGRFTFTGDDVESIVFVGCGVGITPLMSAVRYLTDRSWPGEITLFFGFRTPEDFIFQDELTQLERRHPNLRVVPTVSRPDDTSWTGRTGRIGPELVREVVPNIAEQRVHVCGPKAMMDATRDFLLELGVTRERIRYESFGPATPPPAPVALDAAATALAPTVRFLRSDKSAPLPPDHTVLDVADAIGVEIEWSCRSGTCGSCTVKLVEGEVTMEVDDGLDAEDRAAGLVLACQARATADVAVEA